MLPRPRSPRRSDAVQVGRRAARADPDDQDALREPAARRRPAQAGVRRLGAPRCAARGGLAGGCVAGPARRRYGAGGRNSPGQRARWASLALMAADQAGLPDDPAFSVASAASWSGRREPHSHLRGRVRWDWSPGGRPDTSQGPPAPPSRVSRCPGRMRPCGSRRTYGRFSASVTGRPCGSRSTCGPATTCSSTPPRSWATRDGTVPYDGAGRSADGGFPAVGRVSFPAVGGFPPPWSYFASRLRAAGTAPSAAARGSA